MNTEFSHNLYIDRKQRISNMADLEFNATFEEEVYSAICKHKDEQGNGGTLMAEGDTFVELKEAVRDSVTNYFADGYGAKVGLPEYPSIAVRFTEELYPGNEGELRIRAERNCTKYQTVPNGVLCTKYSHETVEGLRAMVKDAVQKANPNGKKVTLVLEEVLK